MFDISLTYLLFTIYVIFVVWNIDIGKKLLYGISVVWKITRYESSCFLESDRETGKRKLV